ncbi:hypothetical protein [Nocardia sp. NPDC051833]|uniref:hypothetical protein n=1 Tax=Nocardia sp. NPDC051833 TaxID=3155674 RepID=UPI00341296D0
MSTPEMEAAFAALFRQPAQTRIVERATRAAEFRQWAVTLTEPPQGSSLQLDDDGFLQEIGTAKPVARYARFPTSAASEHLAAAEVLVSDWFNGAVPPPAMSRSWPSSVLVMCRSAMESAARTIWLLGDPDREVRRQRCAAEASSELGEMLKWAGQDHEASVASGRDVATFEASAAKLKTAIAKAKEASGTVKVPGFTAMTVAGAAWIDANPPKHARELLDDKPFGLLMKAWYSAGSSFTHGYSWTLNVIDTQEELYGLVADLLMTAVLMTETAVSLFEAQMLVPGEQWQNDHLPARLRPTITEWAPRFWDA